MFGMGTGGPLRHSHQKSGTRAPGKAPSGAARLSEGFALRAHGAKIVKSYPGLSLWVAASKDQSSRLQQELKTGVIPFINSNLQRCLSVLRQLHRDCVTAYDVLMV